MRRFIKKFKNSIIGKVLKAIFKILMWILEIMLIFIAIVIIRQRVTNNQKAFLGFRIFNVATGSMEPEYAVGDILITREKDPSTIVEGDNIVYVGNTADYKGKIITHNVIEIERNEKGEYLFHTKGIANTVEDPIVHEDQLYGIVVQNNKVLAFICKILLNKYGLYFCVVIPIVLYAFLGFVRAQGERIEQEREEERKRKKLEHEKREQRRKLKESQINEEQEMQEIEEDEEVIQAPKKTTTVKKKKTSKESEIEEKIEANSKKKKTATTKKSTLEEEKKVPSKKTSTISKKEKTTSTKKAEDGEKVEKKATKTTAKKKSKEE